MVGSPPYMISHMGGLIRGQYRRWVLEIPSIVCDMFILTDCIIQYGLIESTTIDDLVDGEHGPDWKLEEGVILMKRWFIHEHIVFVCEYKWSWVPSSSLRGATNKMDGISGIDRGVPNGQRFHGGNVNRILIVHKAHVYYLYIHLHSIYNIYNIVFNQIIMIERGDSTIHSHHTYIMMNMTAYDMMRYWIHVIYML